MKNKTLQKFKEAVIKKNKEFKTSIEFFIYLRELNCSRVELMIVDSAIKNMPMENLVNTLLLTQEIYLKIIYNIKNKLGI